MITVAVGGTFNILHHGHRALLERAFASGDLVHIGLTEDGFASRSRSLAIRPFRDRRRDLLRLARELARGKRFTIHPINDAFGVTLERDIDILVVSPETGTVGLRINELRSERGRKPMIISMVDHVLADDGRPISSTRIANREIEPDGTLVVEHTPDSFAPGLVQILREGTGAEPILVHTCCAPCLASPLGTAFSGFVPVGLFYNPNIHPFAEYRRRLDTLRQFSRSVGLRVIYHDDYDLKRFTEGVGRTGLEHGVRCQWCYEHRLERTARTARDLGFGHFTTSLLSSPHQLHDLVVETGERMARRYGLRFHAFDSRDRYRQGVERVRSMGLHVQNYCGCIFSEEERLRRPLI